VQDNIVNIILGLTVWQISSINIVSWSITSSSKEAPGVKSWPQDAVLECLCLVSVLDLNVSFYKLIVNDKS